MTANTAPAPGSKTNRGTKPNDQKERATQKRMRQRERENDSNQCAYLENLKLEATAKLPGQIFNPINREEERQKERERGRKRRKRRRNLSKSVNPHRTHSPQILSLMSYEAQTEDISRAHVAPTTATTTATTRNHNWQQRLLNILNHNILLT